MFGPVGQVLEYWTPLLAHLRLNSGGKGPSTAFRTFTEWHTNSPPSHNVRPASDNEGQSLHARGDRLLSGTLGSQLSDRQWGA